MIDTVVTGNVKEITNLVNIVWPVVAGILSYIAGHWHTSRKKKPRVDNKV